MPISENLNNLPFNHEKFEEFSKELVVIWDDFLRYVQESIKQGKAKQRILSDQGEFQLSITNYSVSPTEILNEKLRMFGSVHGSSSKDQVLLANVLTTQQRISYSTVNSEGRTIAYTTEIAADNDEIIELYKHILRCIDHLKYLLIKWSITHQKEVIAFNKKHYNALHAKEAPDFKHVNSIFNDNIVTLLQMVFLLIGDAQSLTKDNAVDYLIQLNTKKTSQPIHPRYPSLSMVGLFGMLRFAVLGTLATNRLVLKYPQPDIEQTLRDLSSLTVLDNSDMGRNEKPWRGCPALPIIPKTYSVFLDLLLNIYPTKVSINQTIRRKS